MRELWVLYKCVLRQFSVFPYAYTRLFARQITKDYKTFSMWSQNSDKLKHRTHYAIFQNRRIYVSCQLYGFVHYAACVFYPYINCLRSALVGEYGQAAYAVLGRVDIERARA